uniref:uncharacterized protein isoform X2 n=1 Tax=Myxine glutinosa TaxID=7769 RepID=UPI00358E794D
MPAKKRCKIVQDASLQPSTSAVGYPPIDWSRCALCQEHSSEPLQCPAKSKRTDVGAGYDCVGDNLTTFRELGEQPVGVDIAQLDDGDGIPQTLAKHSAQWHSSCHLKCSSSRLARLQRAAIPPCESDTQDCPYTRRQFSRKDLPSQGDVCFFCDEVATERASLHDAMMPKLTYRVKQCALKLQDQELIAKLSSGDLVAQDAKYHAPCLVKLYNAASRKTAVVRQRNTDGVSHGIALAELLGYIEDTKMVEQSVAPMFKLSDLLRLYTDRLRHLGVEVTGRIHSSDLKDRILANVPGIRAYKQGRNVLLGFDDDVGFALMNSSVDNCDDEAICLAKAAQLIRRDMLEMQATFDGSFSKGCQEQAVPKSLVALVSMIMDGPNIMNKETEKVRQATLSMAQLLQYNSYVKRRRGSTGTHHNKNRETPLPIYLDYPVMEMNTEAVCCETMDDDDDSEGWEEWEEKEDLEKPRCLFCERISWTPRLCLKRHRMQGSRGIYNQSFLLLGGLPTKATELHLPWSDCLFDTAEAVFEHCGSEHDFNLEGFVRENGLGFYDYIKMINYIRKKAPRPEELKCEVASRPWESEEFLLPAQVNDGLLQYDVESLLEHLEACGTDGKMETAEEKVTRAEEKLSRAVSDLERMRNVVRDLLNTPEPSVDVASLRPSEDEAYFDSYAQLSIHEEMLKDRVRTQSYQDFIYKNKDLFKDKVVLDVGCGSGILSLFAAHAGACHVFAVEQADVVHWTRETIRENGFDDKITVIHGRIEDVDLPVDKVDVIISEWMGYFLLFESMLDSVFKARDRWLKPGGAVYPDSCALWLVGIGNPAGHEAQLDFWNDVYGFRMSSLRRVAAIEGRMEVVDPKHLLSQPVLVKRIDCCTGTVHDVDFVTNFSLDITRSAQLTGLCGYFEVYFEANCENMVLLSTAPDKPQTHWKQTVLIWEQPFDVTAENRDCCDGGNEDGTENDEISHQRKRQSC